MHDRVANIENEANSPLQNPALRKEITNSPKGKYNILLSIDTCFPFLSFISLIKISINVNININL